MRIAVLRGPRFYTGDPQQPWTDALAVAEGRIVAAGQAAETWAEAPGASVEHLDGPLVIPAFTDAHIHLLWYGQSLDELDLRGLDRAAFHAALRKAVARTEAGQWIVGRGWDQNRWADGRFPTAAELDILAPRHPLFLVAKSAHVAVVNSVALRRAGLSAQTPDPPHGRLGRHADGTLNGLLFESAIERVQQAMPAPTVTEAAEALARAQAHLLQSGITAIHDMDGGPAFAAFRLLEEEGRLHLHIVKYLPDVELETLRAVGLRSGFGSERLRFGGLKRFADGALGSRTAALFAPYEGEPDNVGLLTLERESLERLAFDAASSGVALAVHAIGDRANALVIDVLTEARRRAPRLRQRIEHVQLLAEGDAERLARAGLVASMQPIHAVHDRPMAERYWGARTARAYAWRTLRRAGAVLAFGSDAPVEPWSPWLGLYAAVTRRHEADGAPGREGWHPDQRLTLEEAIGAYTWGAACAAGEEHERGLLRVGYAADLLLLDRDIFRLPPEALLETRVRRVMIGGRWYEPG